VVSVERFRTLADTARDRLAALGYDNVTVVVGDGFAGMADRAPYDRIIITAAAEAIPEDLLDQLAMGGVMVLPLGPHDGGQRIVKLTKTKDDVEREDLIAVRFVPLLPGKAREL
jgi:protein-L-isoaspartate(D-aspartate) O-methyltransferase